jgi:hypothetical protein
LVIGHLARCHAAHKKSDLFFRQRPPVALFSNYVLWFHRAEISNEL